MVTRRVTEVDAELRSEAVEEVRTEVGTTVSRDAFGDAEARDPARKEGEGDGLGSHVLHGVDFGPTGPPVDASKAVFETFGRRKRADDVDVDVSEAGRRRGEVAKGRCHVTRHLGALARDAGARPRGDVLVDGGPDEAVSNHLDSCADTWMTEAVKLGEDRSSPRGRDEGTRSICRHIAHEQNICSGDQNFLQDEGRWRSWPGA